LFGALLELLLIIANNVTAKSQSRSSSAAVNRPIAEAL
jgi:hypothetical protein